MKIHFKHILYLFCLITAIACIRKPQDIHSAVAIKNYGRLSLVKGYSGEKTAFDTTAARQILLDLNKLTEVPGPIKFGKPFQFIIEHKSGASDTLFTNGNVFMWQKKYYKSDENLIQKFDIK